MRHPRQGVGDPIEHIEAKAAALGVQRFAYALWLMLWHYDAGDAWGQLTIEARAVGYDGELFPLTGGAA